MVNLRGDLDFMILVVNGDCLSLLKAFLAKSLAVLASLLPRFSTMLSIKCLRTSSNLCSGGFGWLITSWWFFGAIFLSFRVNSKKCTDPRGARFFCSDALIVGMNRLFSEVMPIFFLASR